MHGETVKLMCMQSDTHACFTRNSFRFCLRVSTRLSLSVTNHVAL